MNVENGQVMRVFLDLHTRLEEAKRREKDAEQKRDDQLLSDEDNGSDRRIGPWSISPQQLALDAATEERRQVQRELDEMEKPKARRR